MFAHEVNHHKNTKFGCTTSSCIFQNSSNAFYPYPYCTYPQHHGCPNDYILRWCLVEHSPNINAPTLCIHGKQATGHKNIICNTTLNDLLVSTLALFKCNHVASYIPHFHKNNRVWSHTHFVAFVQIVIVPLPLLTFHMSQYHCAPSGHISRWHLVEHFFRILDAPTFCMHGNQATPPQRHETCKHFERVVLEQTNCLPVFLNQHMS